MHGTGKQHYEIEVNPLNVVFDAIIHNDLLGNLNIDLSWDSAGMQTSVTLDSNGIRVYDIQIPSLDLGDTPEDGTEWH